MHDNAAFVAGTNLRAHAHALRQTREAVLGGLQPSLHPRELVWRSWSRALRIGLDPGGANPRVALPRNKVEDRSGDSPLGQVIDEIRQALSTAARDTQCVMIVTDADAVILWREGAARTLLRADGLGFSEGATWTESVVGTNAIGTAIVEDQPVQLFGAEHFEHGQLPWYGTASPVHDPRTGELIGVVDISGPAPSLHPMVGALVQSAARLAEMELWRRHQLSLERLRAAAGPLLAGGREPLLLVDKYGWVAHTAGIPPRQRVAVPEGGRSLAVPGLGLCLPEPVADGWLLRPPNADTTVRLVLDLSESPSIESIGGPTSWQAGITARHADILLLLHIAGREGLTASALSQALYGDPAHIVTVRAEVSRMRKVLGGVVTTRPYRLATGVEMALAKGVRWQDSDFVRRSSTPGLRLR